MGPEHADATIESIDLEKHCAFRVNKLLTDDVESIAIRLKELELSAQPISWFSSGFWVDSEHRARLLESSFFQESKIYVQNPSSYLPCLLLAPRPGETVLDLAAAPGGKTLLLAELMENRGTLSAVEPVRNRFFKLQSILKKYGAQIVKTYLSDGRSVGKKVPERFDKVLLDAPCSGEARIHRSDPESWQFWSPRKIKEQARKQFGLIRSAFESLKPGGDLVYCTCSFSPEENEAIISDFVEQTPAAEVLALTLPLENVQPGLASWNNKEFDSAVKKSVRILPDQLMDGFFMTKIRKLNR